jgi:hypothetical protein
MRLMISRSLKASQSSPFPSSLLISCRVFNTRTLSLAYSMNINFIIDGLSLNITQQIS